MTVEIANLTNALEHKLALLHELMGELRACRGAYVGMNLEAIYAHTAQQTTICEKLRNIESERAMAWKAASASGGQTANQGTLSSWVQTLEPAVGQQFRHLLTDLAVAEGEVRHINQVHRVLLEGTRRTLHVLANAMATLTPMYAPPAVLEDVSAIPRGA
jgi:hypothetical protein